MRKLEASGYLSSQSEAAGEKPARRYYAITPDGGQILHAETVDRLCFPRLHTGDFDLALSCLPVLSGEEILSSLQGLKQRLAEQIRVVDAKRNFQDTAMESHVSILFDHMLYGMKAELDWISNEINNMEKKNVK